MKTYLVGGAVRDRLLGLEPHEFDYVVVGTTPELMLEAGFTQVGTDFPVFLHPHSKDEYALARTERKSGHGYTGFSVYSDPSVTLEDDLARRDLTINAIAQDETGQLYDPYGGVCDLNKKLLRHVSDAFIEDPLRVLRVARFASRFYELGFRVAPETISLMKQLAQSGELSHLTAERVWKETSRALMHDRADIYFQVLYDTDALQVIFPEIHALFGIPQRKEYHPEVDCGIHTLMTLRQACELKAPLITRYCALTHDLGKAITPKELLPRHHAHEENGVPLVEQLSDRLKVPTEFKVMAVYVCRYHLNMHRLHELRPSTIYELLKRLDIIRKPERLAIFADACYADATGRIGFENTPYPQREWLQAFANAMRSVDVKQLMTQYSGKELGIQLGVSQIEKIKQQQTLLFKSSSFHSVTIVNENTP